MAQKPQKCERQSHFPSRSNRGGSKARKPKKRKEADKHKGYPDPWLGNTGKDSLSKSG